MNNKTIIALVLQLGGKVRCDLAENRLNKSKTALERVLSNWEVKFDPSKGPTVDDVKRFAGEVVDNKQVETFNAYDPAMPREGGFRVLFAVYDSPVQAEKPVSSAKK